MSCETLQQLSLFQPSQLEPQPDLRQYPLFTIFPDSRTSDIYYVTASSRRQAVEIAESSLRSRGVVFRNVAASVGTFFTRSIHGYPCSPVNKSDLYL